MTQKLISALKSYIFDGLVLIALGICIIRWPEAFLNTLFIVLGAAVILIGVVKAIIFFATEEKNVGDILLGVVLIALGVLLIVKREFFTTAFQYVIGVLLIYGSALLFVRAFGMAERGVKFKTAIAFAILTLLLAVIIFINPGFLSGVIMFIYGASLILEGLAMILILRATKKELEEKKDPGDVE